MMIAPVARAMIPATKPMTAMTRMTSSGEENSRLFCSRRDITNKIVPDV
jgi:hypothetical protein